MLNRCFDNKSNVWGDFTNAKPDGLSIPVGCDVYESDDVPPERFHNPGLWYTFQGTGRRVSFSTIDAASSSLDVAVYKGPCGAESLQCVTAFKLYRIGKFFTFSTELGVVYHLNVRANEYVNADKVFAMATRDHSVLNDNDVCLQAAFLPMESRLTRDPSFFTSDELDVADDCVGGVVDFRRPGSWYKFQGTGQKVTVTTSYFTDVSIYTGACGSTASLQCAAGSKNDEQVSLYTDLGVTYYALLRSTINTNEHSIWVKPTDPVTDLFKNDACSAATPITMGSTVRGALKYAAYQPTDAVPNVCRWPLLYSASGGLWYKFEGTGRRISVAGDCIERGEFTVTVHLFKGSCGASTLECVSTFYVNSCDATPYSIKTEAGSSYYLLVQGSHTDEFGMTLVPESPQISDNDVCAMATPIVVDTPLLRNNFTLATSDETDVLDDCFCGNVTSQIVRGLWYSFYGTGGHVWIDVCSGDDATTSIWVSSVSVYKGSCGLSTLQCVAGSPFLFACINPSMFRTEAGIEYHVLLQNAGSRSSSSLFDVAVRSVPDLAPNDVCATAEPVVIGDTILGDVAFATTDELEATAVCDGRSGGIGYTPGVWYSFQGNGANVKVTYPCDAGAGWTDIHIYKGSCGPSTLECVTGYLVNCQSTPLDNAFEFMTDVGTTYYMLVSLIQSPTNFRMMLESMPRRPIAQNPIYQFPARQQCIVSDPPTAPTVAPVTTLPPTTTSPTTLAPTTQVPTSVTPTTLAPTTDAPTTFVPSTEAPTSAAPTTEAPTTLSLTTIAPTTLAPTTQDPTTLLPATVPPSTIAPTTALPTSVLPTTIAPSTAAPTPTPTALSTTPPTMPTRRRRRRRLGPRH